MVIEDIDWQTEAKYWERLHDQLDDDLTVLRKSKDALEECLELFKDYVSAVDDYLIDTSDKSRWRKMNKARRRLKEYVPEP